MHMADALVAPAAAAAMYACSSIAAGCSVRKIRLESDNKKIPLMGVMGAFVFAAQMINFTIPGTGSSGHLCGAMLLAALLGPYAAFITMIGVLAVQCLMFADGGLLALGCNIWNMAFYGCFIGAMLIWKPFMRKGVDKAKIMAASIAGCVLTLQLGSFSVCLETFASGVTKLPFSAFVGMMQSIHLAIGFVEGLITAAVLTFIYEARPELLWGVPNSYDAGLIKKKISFKNIVIILLAAAVLLGGGVSLAASSAPDGLEWALENTAGTSEPEADGIIHDTAASIQEKTAVLPDYTIKGSDSALGTSLSGIAGGAAVLTLCAVCCCIFRFFGKKPHEQN